MKTYRTIALFQDDQAKKEGRKKTTEEEKKIGPHLAPS